MKLFVTYDETNDRWILSDRGGQILVPEKAYEDDENGICVLRPQNASESSRFIQTTEMGYPWAEEQTGYWLSWSDILVSAIHHHQHEEEKKLV